MRSDVLKPVAMKITFFWDVMSCSLIYRYELTNLLPPFSTLNIEAADFPETLRDKYLTKGDVTSPSPNK
jgi:hypothetical protein